MQSFFWVGASLYERRTLPVLYGFNVSSELLDGSINGIYQKEFLLQGPGEKSRKILIGAKSLGTKGGQPRKEDF